MSDGAEKRLDAIQQKLREHFARLAAKGVSVRCPVCEYDDFMIQDTEAAGSYFEGFRGLDGPVLPRLPLVCRRCFHIVEFAWIPIQKNLQGL